MNLQKIKYFRKKDAKSQSIIIAYIADSHLSYTKEPVTAAEIFKRLESVFEKESSCKRILLRKKLMLEKLIPDGKLKEHLTKFDKVARDLRAAGGKVEEEELACLLLLSLPKSYETSLTLSKTYQRNDLP